MSVAIYFHDKSYWKKDVCFKKMTLKFDKKVYKEA